jgi:hypothetical protein
MVTEHATSRSDLQTLVRRTFVRACEDLSVSYTGIANKLGLGSSTVVERWARLTLPAWVLGDPDAIPDPLYNRIVAVIEAERVSRGRGLRPSCEGAAFAALVKGGEATSVLARLLADSTLSMAERPEAREIMHALVAKCEAVLRAIDDADRLDAGTAPTEPKLAAVRGGR